MSRTILGLDIRNHALTAVLVKSSFRENRIVSHSYIPINVQDEEGSGILAALETLSEMMDVQDCDCVVSLPADQFSFRNLRLPFRNLKKIRMVLPFEIEPTLPFQVDDMILDFQSLNRSDGDDSTAILAAAYHKPQLYAHLEMLKKLGIEPKIVTLSGLAVALCLAGRGDAEEDFLFLEMDKQHATLFAGAKGQIQLIRSFPLASTQTPKAALLGKQIRQTMIALEEMLPFRFEPLECIVSGLGSGSADFATQIGNSINLAVKPASLADRFEFIIDSETEAPWNTAQMDNALALALLEIENFNTLNFHKSGFAAQKFLLKYQSALTKTGILAAAVLVLLFFNMFYQTHLLEKKVDYLDRQISEIFRETFPDVKRIVDPYQQMTARLQNAKKQSALQPNNGANRRSIDILDEISRGIPETTIIDVNRLVIQPDNVLISGHTDTFNSVDDIKGNLEKAETFKKVTISSANLEKSGEEVRFMLKVEL